jgi:hypothetical protein
MGGRSAQPGATVRSPHLFRCVALLRPEAPLYGKRQPRRAWSLVRWQSCGYGRQGRVAIVLSMSVGEHA